MEMALEIVVPWLSAHDVGHLARTCKAMADAARLVNIRRLRDATQGWEHLAVPIENHVDDCLYPQFQYTPFSLLSSSASSSFSCSSAAGGYADVDPKLGSLLPFGGPWGGGEEGVAETTRRRKAVRESEFGGAMVAGSVLLGPGVGCRCDRDDCSTVINRVSDGDWSPESVGDEVNSEASEIRILSTGPSLAGARSSGSLARRQPDLDNVEPLDDGVKKKRKREEHNGDTADSQWELHKRNEEQDNGNDVLDCFKTNPVKASFCPCGRFMGGEVAYDTNSRLRFQNVNPPKVSAAISQGQHCCRSSNMLEETTTSMQVPHQDVVDNGQVHGDVDDPPLVMECGQACSCSSLCQYRVSQNGLAVRAKVVRTSFKGWGLCAKQGIAQGSFVCEYAGELITTAKARERHKLYDSEKYGKHWQGSALLTVREHLPSGQASVRVNVDATRIGNVARFINHSCDRGNLVPCLIRTAGCVIPKLALFARRDISDGEEFSYSYGSADVNAEPWKPCFCGTPPCIGRLPSECT
ncbi:unnamed protein product [Calypogeia fissa]